MRWLMVALLLALAASSGLAEGEVERGGSAPEFEAQDFAGKKVKLSEFRGKESVLLAFWSRECPVSTGELPALEKLHATNKGKPLVVLGASIDDAEAADLTAWMKERKLTFRGLRDSKRSVASLFGARVTPTFYLIGKDGKVQARYAGGGETLRQALAEDVAELLRDGKVTPREAPAEPVRFG